MKEKGTIVKRIGITGGIGSGKTEACKILERLGEKVLYADLIAKDLTENNIEIKNEIKNVFGLEFFDKSGKLDRKKLADLVFSDDEALAVLNSLVHPHVFSFIDEEVSLLAKNGGDRIFVEAALIFETYMDENLDVVIVIDSEKDTRLKRVKSRDGMTESEFKKRVDSQMSSEEKVRLADFTIKNNGSLGELERNLTFIISLINNLNIDRNDKIS
jgi:dephospho-CoA kinase